MNTNLEHLNSHLKPSKPQLTPVTAESGTGLPGAGSTETADRVTGADSGETADRVAGARSAATADRVAGTSRTVPRFLAPTEFAQPAYAETGDRERSAAGSDGLSSAGGGQRSAGGGGRGAEPPRLQTRRAEWDEERIARAGLSRVIEPGDPVALETFAELSAVEAWRLLKTSAPRFERWAPRVAEVRPERDLERAEAAGARFVIPGDDEWPEQVEVLADAGQQSRRGGVPFGLWVRGKPDLRQTLANSVALVGARACSSYGEHAASELATGLAENGTTVVSGGAYGIDAAAHRGALAGSGTTIAILACGVDVSYPKSNTNLFDRIAEDGLLVSELPPGCSPTKLRFLARNRLIAATTLGTVVVEAAVRSGALNSAGWAEQCGRPVLAVPGPITSRMSEGVHLLVRERNAVLATSVADVLEAISPLGTRLTTYPHAPATPTDNLDPDVQRTLDAVPVVSPAPATRIATTAGLDLDTVQECLETLAELDLVEYHPPGWRLSPNHRHSLTTLP